MRTAIILLALISTSLVLAWVEPPQQYPTEPTVAVANYLDARQTLAAKTQPLGSAEIKPAQFIGRSIEVSGQFVGRLTVNAGADNSQELLRVSLTNGQMLSVLSTSRVEGLYADDVIRMILEGEEAMGSDNATEPRFHLRAICLESDFPKLQTAPQKTTPPVTATPSKVVSDLVTPLAVPSSSLPQGSSTVPQLAPFTVPVPAPRTGKEGAWDPVGNMGFPMVQQRQLDAWVPWVRKLNSRLTEAQADWIVRWIIYYSAANGVDHRLMFAMIKCESSFNPFCVSRAGATGLTQLMPFNVTDFRVANKWNVQEQIRAGVEHFKEMLDMWRGRSNWDQFALAAASYNAGPNRVKRAGGIPNITETKNYVKKLGDLFYQLHRDGFP